MRTIILVILTVFSIGVANAQRLRKNPSVFDKVLHSMFQPRKTIKPKPKVVTKVLVIIVESKKSTPRIFIVDPQWIARYWELEMAWDYWIPEDEQIKFRDGKYIVPIVVFKHYEDMANTARRPSAVNSIPAIS